MINAKEACELMNSTNSEKAQEQIELIEKAIVKHAENGECYCTVDFWTIPSVENRLKELGYVVKRDSGRNESWTTIRWSNDVC